MNNEVQFSEGDIFLSDYLITDKKNIPFHHRISLINLLSTNNLALCYGIRGDFFIRFIFLFFIKIIEKIKIMGKVMEQKPKNKIEKTNKIQGQNGDIKKMPHFFKESVSHGSKMQKDLHSKFFFKET